MNYEATSIRTKQKTQRDKANLFAITIILLLLVIISGLVYTNIRLGATKSDLEYELTNIQNSVTELRNEIERQ